MVCPGSFATGGANEHHVDSGSDLWIFDGPHRLSVDIGLDVACVVGIGHIRLVGPGGIFSASFRIP